MSDAAERLETQPVPKPEPALDPSAISVAVTYPGNRVDKVAVPLEASAMDVAIDPPDPYARDIVLVDNADRDLGKEVLRKPTHDATVVYRMRGDVFRELELWPMHWIKKWAARRVVLPNVDAAIAVTDLLARKFTEHTGVPSGSAGLCKDPDEWPTVTHDDQELRIVTLTNANYRRKIEPLIEWAPVVDAVLDDVGGRWHICGDGTHADRLERECRDLYHVSYEGYVDADAELAEANLMLHPSRLDGQPNSILEGLASGLPVVTNAWSEFVNFGWPLDVVPEERTLPHTLRRYTDPRVRARRGREGVRHIREHHSTEAVAASYEQFFAGVLSDG